MAHYQQLKFVELVSEHLPPFFKAQSVLEVGSWIANDSVRKFFVDCRYVGADVAQGPGVDIVCPGEALDFADASFDVVISGECFEHNPAWQATFNNMIRMLKPGGLCLITCATIGRREHGTNRRVKGASLTSVAGHDDHYQNLSKKDLEQVARGSEAFADFRTFYNPFMYDVYLIGIKRSEKDSVPSIPARLITEVDAITEETPPNLFRALRKRIKFHLVFAFARLLGEKRYHDFNHWARSFNAKSRRR